MEHALLALIHGILHSLSPVHYFGFFIAFFAWVLLAIITYALRKNNLVLSLMTFLTFIFFFAAPVISYITVESVVKNSSIADLQTKQLRYIDKVVIKGDLTNHSRRTLKECRLLTYGFDVSGNLVDNVKAIKKTIRFAALNFDKPLTKGGSEPVYISLGGISDMDSYYIRTFTFCR